jgi:hypothetical protein
LSGNTEIIADNLKKAGWSWGLRDERGFMTGLAINLWSPI